MLFSPFPFWLHSCFFFFFFSSLFLCFYPPPPPYLHHFQLFWVGQVTRRSSVLQNVGADVDVGAIHQSLLNVLQHLSAYCLKRLQLLRCSHKHQDCWSTCSHSHKSLRHTEIAGTVKQVEGCVGWRDCDWSSNLWKSKSGGGVGGSLNYSISLVL